MFIVCNLVTAKNTFKGTLRSAVNTAVTVVVGGLAS